MNRWTKILGLACVAVLFAGVAAVADDEEQPQSASAEQPAVSAEKIAALVEQLDDNSFAKRKEASEQLEAIGEAAVEALTKAAQGDSLEQTTRSIELLKKLAEDSNEEALAGLKEIAECDVPAAARRAADAVKAVEQSQAPALPGINVQPGQGGAIRIQAGGGGMIQVMQGGAGGFSRSVVTDANGVQTITGNEGDIRVKIVKDPAQGIKMTVTEKKNGKDVTRTISAKDAEELKKKDAEAHKLFDKFDSGKGNNIVFGNIRLGGIPNLPNLPAQQQKRIQAMQKQFGLQLGGGSLKTAGTMISRYGDLIERHATDNAIDAASNEAREELKKQVAESKQKLTELENRLQKAIEKSKATEKEAESEE